ncbi:JAB domain-containing protein [Taibaiella soli]|uniref:DNA repair protein n=1 Tax=Taibaiella soli TaxID=1649169 RepID=A0A2W2APQ1_9BACT|nr:JAB domain-containing protein [Taibaiella soli]PZF74380.1 DNA repair protein [Taibaiella soli]
MNVRLSKEQKVTILNQDDIYKVMQQILLRENKIRRNQEHFWVVGLNTTNKILFAELVALGATDIVQVKPPEVFRMGIYKLATKVILVHNHPSGEVSKPSKADIDLTDRLYKAGKIVLIEVLDHLVISETSYYSFQEKGLMEKIANSGKYELTDRSEMQLLEIKIKEEIAAEKERFTIAAKMKKEGFELAVIKKMTGLGKKDIEKL